MGSAKRECVIAVMSKSNFWSAHNTLEDLRNRYGAGDIDTEQYLAQIDVLRAQQGQKIFALVALVICFLGVIGVLCIKEPETTHILTIQTLSLLK